MLLQGKGVQILKNTLVKVLKVWTNNLYILLVPGREMQIKHFRKAQTECTIRCIQ